jgi:hypothetical protein
MSRGGPWHATRLRRGDAFMEEIKAEFLAVHPAGTTVSHNPKARLMVLRKLWTRDEYFEHLGFPADPAPAADLVGPRPGDRG